MPYGSYVRSAQVLDDKRLGKQRVEAIQILHALHKQTGWANHPATKMWEGYERSLVDYLSAVCSEWVSRGFKNTKCSEHLYLLRDQYKRSDNVVPHWVGDAEFHMSHRAKLQWKNPAHYRPIFRLGDIHEEPTYVWPEGCYR